MPGTLFDPQDRQRILDRVSALSPERTRRWGRMTVHQVVPHMAEISGHDWGVLAWRHMDHHLTQFGV
jgi:2-phospho-L-lactate transferase/gluconeogenesis factor (CofD/UPF0052 family)